MYQCQDCGHKFRTIASAQRAAESDKGCPGCGGSDVDLGSKTPAYSILLTYVTSSAKSGRRFPFVTLETARRKAHALLSPNPRRDPDGYAVNRQNGHCLWFHGCTFEQLFPAATP